MGATDRFVVTQDPALLRGRPIRTMPITIGGLPKLKLLEQVKAVRFVSPYAERIMKHEDFTTLEKPETAVQIILTPQDFGFTKMAEVADLLNHDRVAAWSKANLENEFLWMAMERIPGYAGRPYLFYIERDDDEVFSLDAHWMYPAAPWPLHYTVAFRLCKKSNSQ
jgi:hypothetical protein